MRRAFGTLLAGMVLAVLSGGSAMAAPAADAPPNPVPICLGVDVLGLDLGQGGCGGGGVAPA